jgi:hypothetical protein
MCDWNIFLTIHKKPFPIQIAVVDIDHYIMSRVTSQRSGKDKLEGEKALRMTNLVLNRFHESKALQEFGTAKRSEEYNAVYEHLCGVHVFGLKRSAFAGVAVFGVLLLLPMGRLPAATFAGLVAVLASREHVFNETRTWKRWSSVPLVEGRSVFSDELCSDVVKAYHRFDIGKEPVENPVLKNIESMVHNCQRRQAFEERLRNDRGLHPGVPVSIPPPGVPADYPF